MGSRTFKQNNKVHKSGRHRTKRSISNDAKGKVSVKKLTKQVKKQLGKDARRLQSQQIRHRKREEVLLQKRNLGGSSSAPILLCIIPLQENFNVDSVISVLTNADETINIYTSACGITHISLPRFKQRFSIIVPPLGNMIATLDAAKVSDTILFAVSAISENEETSGSLIVDPWGEEVMQALVAQGMPTTIVTLSNLESLHTKKRQDYKANVQKVISKWLPEEKISLLDKPVDALNVLRKAGSQKQRTVTYRNKRPYMIAEHIKFLSDQNNDHDFGTMEVSGYLRGKPLSVNGLIHIPGFGDFQMSRIDAPNDPYPLEKVRQKISTDVNMEQDPVRILETADPNKQESLESENIPDPMDAEQTWPTEEELAKAQQPRKIVKRVPKGTSEYQAAWIPDEDGESVADSDDDESTQNEMMVDDAQSEVDSTRDLAYEDEEYETLTISEAAPDEQKYDEQMDMSEEMQAIKKIKEAKLDAQFPDEVDTPQDTLAKIRFQKYRGLASFKTSPWDPKENLPTDYARIFQFENFERTRKRILKEQEESEGALPGWYITIHVKNVNIELFKTYVSLENRPLIIFGLIPYEHKMSVLNIFLKRTTNNVDPIKSKESLVFQCGFRRFRACPIFSQHTNGNKHKYERYFQPDSSVVASVYAPITFPPCPVLCYIEKSNRSLELVATGSILSVNPDRLIIKRVVLSGHPFKVHKRSAVIRFMFFYREDINWFKPVELRTKYGRRGHIKEPLGTHGHMKCVFDGQLKSQDTVLMNLYKRIFPKWTYEPLIITEYSSKNADVLME